MLLDQPVSIVVNVFKVNSVDHSAVINMGPSAQIDLFIAYKRNQGIGEQNGDFSPISLTNSFVLDSDLSDANSIKNSIL